eukprot:scaffold83920_cov65-Phaeocystis_antarctica.AAC.2
MNQFSRCTTWVHQVAAACCSSHLEAFSMTIMNDVDLLPKPQVPDGKPPSSSKAHVEKKLRNAQDAGVEALAPRGMSDATVPPALDVDLSKLLSKLLRHKAVELEVAIDTDGWVALSDALVQINGPKLRALVGNAEKLGPRVYTEANVREYTEADVREVVDANDKRRFVINGTNIRATQGHGMHGVGEKQGEPLTLETAPEVAVHGLYVEHVQAILEQGLSRMGRHHVHLAKGLLGEKGVVSGMRSDAELFICTV